MVGRHPHGGEMPLGNGLIQHRGPSDQESRSAGRRVENSVSAMNITINQAAIESVILEVSDAAAAEAFYTAAFGLGDKVRVRTSEAPATGFRGFILSLVVSQPSTVDSLIGTAVDAGATTLKPAKKS